MEHTPQPIHDQFGRTFSYLRLSVTDRCNLSCQYCNPVKMCAPTNPDLLSWDDMLFIVQTCVEKSGLRSLRITGGEPTVRPGLTHFIEQLSAIDGLTDIAMTTNGVMLSGMAERLASAGLRRVNISLDCWNPERFQEITRGGNIERVLEGIEAARKHFDPVKINCVALRSVFETEIEQFLAFAFETGIEVRFIELMPIFDQKDFFEREFISAEEMQTRILECGWSLDERIDAKPHGSRKNNAPGNGPAIRFRATSGDRFAHLGFISQMSETKCLTCNKLRMTSDGALKPCLLMPEEVSLASIIRNRDGESLIRIMTRSFQERAEAYTPETIRHEKVPRSMQSIGG